MAFEELKKTMESHGFRVSVFATGEAAADYLDRVIDHTSVGCGGSMTVKELGLFERLGAHNQLYYHGIPGDRAEILKKAAEAEVYLLSANGIAADTGEILNIDGTGNRVASSIYGHKRVYFVAGRNKISPDFPSALWRVRNVVAPRNAQRLGRRTPCAAKADKCYDCSSPERICCALAVHYRPLHGVETEVVLVDEELGY